MPSFSRRSLLLVMIALVSLPPFVAIAADSESSDTAQAEFFERKVRPLLVEHCFSCHARGSERGGLSLSNRAGLLEEATAERSSCLESDESSLIAAIEQRGDVQMPPNGKLSNEEIAILRKWIELGASWPESATKDGGGIRAGGAITDEDRQFCRFVR